MKALKLVLIACSLSAAIADAQTAPESQNAQPIDQAQAASATQSDAQPASAVTHAQKANKCVGPASFCNIYMGS